MLFYCGTSSFVFKNINKPGAIVMKEIRLPLMSIFFIVLFKKEYFLFDMCHFNNNSGIQYAFSIDTFRGNKTFFAPEIIHVKLTMLTLDILRK